MSQHIDKDGNKSEQVWVWMPSALKEAFGRLARRHNRSRSAEMRHHLETSYRRTTGQHLPYDERKEE